jgi:hypothetical protein
MAHDKLIFFEARRHTGSEGFVLYVGGESPNVPRKREDLRTAEELITYLGKFNLQNGVTPEQVLQQLMLPPQKHTNPPGTKFMFTARETPAEKRDCVVMLSRADIEMLERALKPFLKSTTTAFYGPTTSEEEIKRREAEAGADDERARRLLDELHRAGEQAA